MSENMLFCLGEDKWESKGIGYQKHYMVFNTQVGEDEFEKIKSNLSGIEISMNRWIEEKDMTRQEKKDYGVYKELGGYLKTISYEEAWANWWEEASQKDRNKILDIKYFDQEIFEGITGIDVSKDKRSTTKKKELINKAQELKDKADELLEEANKL